MVAEMPTVLIRITLLWRCCTVSR